VGAPSGARYAGAAASAERPVTSLGDDLIHKICEFVILRPVQQRVPTAAAGVDDGI
jgi:hypothetical protein